MSQTQQNISTLVREAAKSEANFLAVMNQELLSDAPQRIEEFFSKLNIPRSTKADDTLVEQLALGSQDRFAVTSFEDEVKVAEGIQKFMDRHMRKLKWHVAHPAIEGITNCVRLYRAMGITTELRVLRILALMKARQRLSVAEWGVARELLNRAYRELREATGIVTGPWIDALFSLESREQVLAELAPFGGVVSSYVQSLRALRDAIEERRAQMEVKPEGYAVVRPPRYFGGDLLDAGSWRHFWGEITGMSDALRNTLGQ